VRPLAGPTRTPGPTEPAPARPVAPWIGAIHSAIAEVRQHAGATGLRAALEHLAVIREISTLCAGIHEVLGEILPARNFAVVLASGPAECLDFIYHVDEIESVPANGTQRRDLVHYVIRTNRPLLATADVFNRLVAAGEVDPLEVPLAAWLGVPLSDGDSAFGALVVKTYGNARRVGPRELELLEVASRHVAQAVARRHAVEALEQSEARFRALAEHAPCAIFILQGAQVRFANQAAMEVTGYCREDFDHRSLWDVVHPDGREAVHRRVAGMARSRTPTRHEVKILRKDGQSRWIDFSACTLSFGGRPAIMGVGLDVTARKLTDARIEVLAYHDALTGLANRRLLEDRIGVAIAQARRRHRHLAVLFLDLDDFKDVNDSLGHHAGDLLLQAVARRLEHGMRSDDTVARIGGDEFVVLLTHVADAEQAAAVADKVLLLLKAPFQIAERELFVNASLGIATFPEDGADAVALLKNADAALYRAKRGGRDNCQPYTLSLHTAAIARLDMESGLRRAQERGELFVEYQPALDLESGRVYGVEALLRWRHPSAGVLQPAAFLPLAESSSIIVPMGSWVLATACRQAKAWQALGFPNLTMAVNIAARQFQDPAFLGRLASVLAETGLRPGCLELEITESHAMENAATISEVLANIHALGVRISIDDFGTGYSSLSYLTRLPIHSLKVDKSFIQSIASGPTEAAIASAIIQLAHTLKLTVQAEGVETREQMDILTRNACDRIQGYYYSKPLSVVDCEAFLAGTLIPPPAGRAPAAAGSPARTAC
jgi:diguanylate cyclase (GGDEF)-like protein/PAS domain S-box-containing protein